MSDEITPSEMELTMQLNADLMLPPTYTARDAIFEDFDHRYIVTRQDRLLGHFDRTGSFHHFEVFNSYSNGCRARIGFEGGGVCGSRTNFFCQEPCVHLESLGREMPVCARHLTRFYQSSEHPGARRFADETEIDFTGDLELVQEILEILVDLRGDCVEDHALNHAIANLERHHMRLNRQFIIERHRLNVHHIELADRLHTLDIFPDPARELIINFIRQGPF